MQAYTVTVENRPLEQSYPSSSLLGSNNYSAMQDHQLNSGTSSSALPQQMLHSSDANYYRNGASQQDLAPPPPQQQQFNYPQQQQQHQPVPNEQLHQMQHHQQTQFSVPPSTSPIYMPPRPRSKSAITITAPPKVDTNGFEEPETPRKRKRGRPPKASSLTNQITTTLNISVNTSPLNTSPMAESNSLSSARRGVPDFFTPLMRVSPTSRTKKKRKNSSTSTSNSPTLIKKQKSTSNLSDSVRSASTGNISDNVLITPMSSVNGSSFGNYHQINAKTLDNLSMVTQSNPNMGGESLPYYNTPPSSTVKSQFPAYLAPPPPPAAAAAANSSSMPAPQVESGNIAAIGFNNQPATIPVTTHSRQANDATNQDSSSYLIRNSSSTPLPLPLPSEENLLPAVSLVPGNNTKKIEGKISPKTIESNINVENPVNSPLKSASSSNSSSTNDFSLKLLIDDSGKAVLSTDFFSNPSTSTATENDQSLVVEQNTKKSRAKKPKPAKNEATEEVVEINHNVESQIVINGLSSAKQSQLLSEVQKPRLTHVNSVIGIESQYAQSIGLSPPLTMTNSESAEYQQQSRPNLLRRHNSDFIGVAASSIFNQNTNLSSINEHGNVNITTSVPAALSQLPQTPNYRENYLYSTTGLTPNSNLTFNLTPQFNSMMYSMMNINSPQQKKSSGIMSNQQFLISQEFYQPDSLENPTQNTSLSQDQYVDQSNNQGKTIYMNDLLSMRDESIQVNEKPTSTGIVSDPPSSSGSGSSSNEDSGDARLALKKIIHIKRK